MKLIIVSVYDQAVQAFGRPAFVVATGAALRSFSDEANRKAPDNQLANHPEDFSLYELGLFDEQEGSFELLPLPRRLVNAVEVLVAPK